MYGALRANIVMSQVFIFYFLLIVHLVTDASLSCIINANKRFTVNA